MNLKKKIIFLEIYNIKTSKEKMTRIGDMWRKIHGIIYEKPTNFSWVLENKLAGCGLPMSEREVCWLQKQGIKTIISIREVPLESEWIPKEITYLHVKVDDFMAPTITQLDETIKIINNNIINNNPVLVHCLAGKGRTGTILASYLLKIEKISASQAINKIRQLRPGSVQSEIQEDIIKKYEKLANFPE